MQQDLLLSDIQEHDAVHYWGESAAETRGEVLTKPEVAKFILDLTGWRVGENLLTKRLLEPSCGAGNFVIPAIRRLLADAPKASTQELAPCLCAIEVNRLIYERLHEQVKAELEQAGFNKKDTEFLLDEWLHHADFLTRPFANQFTHVIGNPPYLRIEALPRKLMDRYRTLFRTMYDRADLYIAFYEKGLSLLQTEGKLGYICANRWTKNRYGGPLRELIADRFHMETYIDFTGIDAFHGEVIAYPAVTIIRNGSGNITKVIEKENVHCDALPELADRLIGNQTDTRINKMSSIADKGAPWLLNNASRIHVVQELERRFPTLEEADCKVGIGIATGADKVYIGSDARLDVEKERKLPLLTRSDIRNNRIQWTGKYVLNPFDGSTNTLVQLEHYPRFKAYLESHREAVERRHVARKNPHAWFKTIDRIYPKLKNKPKLVIPDIQGASQVAYDEGNYYPHHNLYHITSNCWDLQALQTVLRSSLANAFVATYSLRMRGDCLRFQAQYLRRIRLPLWSTLSPEIKFALISAATSDDTVQIDTLVRSLYELDDTDWNALCRS